MIQDDEILRWELFLSNIPSSVIENFLFFLYKIWHIYIGDIFPDLFYIDLPPQIINTRWNEFKSIFKTKIILTENVANYFQITWKMSYTSCFFYETFPLCVLSNLKCPAKTVSVTLYSSLYGDHILHFIRIRLLFSSIGISRYSTESAS